MFDIGFTELLVIGVVALIVVGPKDLPGMFRTLGRFTARARQMGREFSQAMNEAADESGAKDIADTFKSATSSKAMGLDALNKAADGFEKWDPSKTLRDQKTGDAATKSGAKDGKTELDKAGDEAARKIQDTTTKATADRKAADAAKSAEMLKVKRPPSKRPTERTIGKPDAAKAPAKKTAAKKPAAKKPAPKTQAAKKPAAKKPVAKKPAAKSATKPKTKPTDKSNA
ncbi:Sec-independent protein translocase protein TatB [Aliiroseovarius sp. S1339]|uniref:Sec-independent protein translocase protein TatB n=1 Tax=Aliiroseovarius sp. S1339 TaxID=2936990 RepID=UPI0020C0C8C3|nr:Sec-independent protein translocase protein TatB [Aliiroseovarius sp. S1339]MCK8464756.1 Sec-independent protein translocase protein TatB [Aliiroseovarius sp. S1339]